MRRAVYAQVSWRATNTTSRTSVQIEPDQHGARRPEHTALVSEVAITLAEYRQFIRKIAYEQLNRQWTTKPG